jgi:hypothetical protein
MQWLFFLQTAQFIAESWSVSSKNVQNCFAHRFFLKHSEMPNKADSESDVRMEMHHVGNYQELSCNNSSL